MDDTRDSDEGTPAPWTQPRFVFAAVGLGLIAVFGLVLVVTGPSGPAGQEARRAPAPAVSPSPAATADVAASACGLDRGEQDVPVAAPGDSRWELVGTMAAPTAPALHGPGSVDDGFRACFAHSPMGALYAAISFWAMSTAKPAADVMERLTARTAERRRAIRDARAAGDEPELDRTTTLQIAGFRFVSYDGGGAVIELVVRVSNGGLASLPTTMRWEDGDWRYVVPLDGDPDVRQVPSLAGYAAWSGA